MSDPVPFIAKIIPSNFQAKIQILAMAVIWAILNTILAMFKGAKNVAV